MTNFFDEICESVGLETSSIKGNYKLAMLGFNSAYLEGHKGLLIFSSTEMGFKVKGGNLKICGDNLELKNFSKKSALIKGKIKNVELCEDGKI